MLCMFLAGATGGGDVKLATALGAFLGPEIGLSAIAWCHVLAGVCSCMDPMQSPLDQGDCSPRSVLVRLLGSAAIDLRAIR